MSLGSCEERKNIMSHLSDQFLQLVSKKLS